MLDGVPARSEQQPQAAPAQQQRSLPRPPAPLDVHLKFKSTVVDGSLSDDPALRELIAPYEAGADKRIKEVIGSTDREIGKGLAGGLLGNFVTDVMRAEGERVIEKRIDLAIQNSGGLRNPIPQGAITVETIFRVMPFENEIFVLTMTGSQLTRLLEFMASKTENRGGDAQSGARIVIEGGKLLSAKVRGAPIDAKASYVVAVSDYLYGGGSGYSMLAEVKNYTPLNLTLRDAIINYIRRETAAGRIIKPRFDGRLKILDEHSDKGTPPDETAH